MKPAMKPSHEVIGKKPVTSTLFSLMRKYSLRLEQFFNKILPSRENRPESPAVRGEARDLLRKSNPRLARVVEPSSGHIYPSSKEISGKLSPGHKPGPSKEIPGKLSPGHKPASSEYLELGLKKKAKKKPKQ